MNNQNELSSFSKKDWFLNAWIGGIPASFIIAGLTTLGITGAMIPLVSIGAFSILVGKIRLKLDPQKKTGFWAMFFLGVLGYILLMFVPLILLVVLK